MATSAHSRDRRRALAPTRTTCVPVQACLAADASDADDANRLRWVRVFGRAPFQYGDKVWDLDAKRTDPKRLQFRWSDVAAALTAQPSRFAPTVTREHRRDGTGLGTAVRIVELTAAEARAKGIRQEESHAIYAGLRLTSQAARDAYDRGELQWVSPAVLAALPTDEPGHTAPIWIDEISFVTVPHLRGQPNLADQMRSVQLSGANMNAHEIVIKAIADEAEKLGIDPEKAAKLVGRLREVMGTEEANEAEDMRKLEEVEAELASKTAECAEMAANLGKLHAELTAVRVDRDTADRTVDAGAKAALAMLAATNETAYQAMLSALPGRTATPVGAGPVAVPTRPAPSLPVTRNPAMASLSTTNTAKAPGFRNAGEAQQAYLSAQSDDAKAAVVRSVAEEHGCGFGDAFNWIAGPAFAQKPVNTKRVKA